jgi:DNA repair protein RadC
VLAQSRDDVGALTDDRVGRLTSATSAAIAHALRQRLARRPLSGGESDLLAYLVATMADLDHEQLRVLYLDLGNCLIRDEAVASGSVARMTIYPRTVLRRAIVLNASAMIIVHNHPGGSAEPSADDVEGTRRIVALAASLDITVHDHIIVAGHRLVSLRSRGGL